MVAVFLEYGVGFSGKILALVEPAKANAQESPAKPAEGSKTAASPGSAVDPGKPLVKAADEAKDKMPAKPSIQSSGETGKFQQEKLKEIEQNITDQLRNLREVQAGLDDRLTQDQEQKEVERNRHLAKLIKIVNSMRPESAGQMLGEMDDELAVQILLSLSGAKASKILANLPAKKAASISSKMVAYKPGLKLQEVMKNWNKMAEEGGKRVEK